MDNKGGLIELVLVFAFVLGWGVLELRSHRQYKKRQSETKPPKSKDPLA